MIVETFGDRTPRFATLFDGGVQAIHVCTQGSACNQFSFEGSRSVSYNSLLGFGTCTMGNFFELLTRDEGVNIENHGGVHNIQGIDEQRMFQKPSPNDQVVHVFLAGAFGWQAVPGCNRWEQMWYFWSQVCGNDIENHVIRLSGGWGDAINAGERVDGAVTP